MGDLLVKLVFPDTELKWPPRPVMFDLPPELYIVLSEDFLPSLSKKFTDAAHDGPLTVALRGGLLLLALYLVIYPPRFPQIGELIEDTSILTLMRL